MPYSSNSDLPESIKDHLPAAAQNIYREAFNHAWKQYEPASKRQAGASREETAHKVAWAAVKKSYHKGSDGKWVKN